MPNEDGRLKRAAWIDRAQEEANLFNPAFVATLLVRMAGDYARKAGKPMPLALAFLLVPIVLHRRTRDALPRSTITGVLSWLQDNKDQHFTFSARMRATRQMTQEGLMFAMAYSCLDIDKSALSIGKKRLPAAFAKDEALTEETRDCLEKASFVGRWFAGAGSTNTIYAAWGVAP